MTCMKSCCVLALIALILLLAGCQESDSQLVRRAQLVGHENIQLKKQLKEKDREMEALRQEMTQKVQECEQQLNDSAESSFKLLEIVAQNAKELEECRAELDRLKSL